MNDREMLERLETVRTPSCPYPICPVCANSEGCKPRHKKDCWLGKHLYPEAVEGSDKWALATGRAGRKVCRRAWKGRDYLYRDETGQWRHSGGTTGLTPASYPNTHDWELYAPPEPETVRWALERELGGLRMHLPNGNEFYPIHELATCRVVSGYRLKTFVGHTKSGAGVNMGNLTKVWIRYPLEVCPTPGPQGQGEPVWADTAVMERVAQ